MQSVFILHSNDGMRNNDAIEHLKLIKFALKYAQEK